MSPRSSRVNVAEAKKSLSELIGRVAYGQETITILKRGRPMARLVPVNAQSQSPLTDEILAARHAHRPRRPPGLKGGTLQDWTAD